MHTDLDLKIAEIYRQISATYLQLETALIAMENTPSPENQAAIAHFDETLNFLVDRLLEIEEQENIAPS
jgi:hypothetical protein